MKKGMPLFIERFILNFVYFVIFVVNYSYSLID